MFHLDKIVDVGFKDGVIITAIEHPAYRAQLFDQFGCGMMQILHGRSVRKRPEPSGVVWGVVQLYKKVVKVKQPACGVACLKDIGMPLGVYRSASASH